MSYKAPIKDMSFLLKHVFDVQSQFSGIEQYADFDYELYEAVLEEGAKFAESVLLPLNRSGDEEGCTHSGTEVTTPAGFKEAYQQFCESGWAALNGDPEFGGQGLPKTLHVLVEEMLYASNTSFTLYPSLTSGACHAIAAHASDSLKQFYLEKMLSGEWAGSMCLTEPHSGSDLGLLKTKAIPTENDTYELTGTKIFITGGEHDLTDNIIHLVLARLPDAPEGPKGISLFLVPKFMLDDSGNIAERNGISCGSIEHKMGIKASSTCVMNLDNAKGFLIGAPGQGLSCMFTMMNKERLSISIQGIGLAEISYQVARQYAEERLQGRSSKKKGTASIIEHADVRRMLLSMRSLTEMNRAMAVYLGMLNDLEDHSPSEEQRALAKNRVALLTPIAKSFFTDSGYENCNHGIQVLGGHGYVREWGVEQFVRDARIAQIYEGTNGIQAQDFLLRKVAADSGATLRLLVSEMQQFCEDVKGDSSQIDRISIDLLTRYEHSLTELNTLTELMLSQTIENAQAAQGCAVEYLNTVALVIGGWLWLRMLAASDQLPEVEAKRKQAGARFYFEHQLIRMNSYSASIKQGFISVAELDDELI